ncbi:MAG: TIR domain-containing protein [Gammaproteobacteria bacterium]|nr:TIR domain-containing protein [Gammaproteobacteria bacterium]
MQGIFISYRREDSAGHAGRLFDRLCTYFGKDSVFMDVEGIEAGVDFVETIEQAVGGCEVLLAIIGRGWLDSKNSQGDRRLDDPQDFIRLETAAALARKVRVIPVLVEGAQMPPAESLPAELRTLTRRQAVELRDSRWEDDIQALIKVLERVLTQTPARATEKKDERRDTLAWAWKGGAAALLLGAVILGGTLISNRWGADEREAALQPAPATEAQPATVLQPDTPTTPEPSSPLLTEKPAAAKPAAPKPAVKPTPASPVAVTPVPVKPAPVKPAPVKPIIAKPQPSAAPTQAAVAQPAPAPAPPVATAPQPQPKAAIASVAPTPAPAAPRTIAVIALGEPTFRDFWEGERRAAYSAKVAGIYRDALREAASGRVELSINIDSARDLRRLDKALRETPGLCDTLRTEAVFVARLEEPQSISSVESAYWPELRLTAIACDSGKQTSARANLSPMRDDGFPFERQMAQTMEKFARENRRLLQ